jgi:alpha-glucuronidase
MCIRRRMLASIAVVAVAAVCPSMALSETGYDAWLRYPRITDATTRSLYESLPTRIVLLGDSEVLRSARDEITRGLESMLGNHTVAAASLETGDAIVLGTNDAIRRLTTDLAVSGLSVPGSFRLRTVVRGPQRVTLIAGADERGVLYGTFALLRRVATHQPIAALDERQEPGAPLRWVNEWNNLDGTIERGYGGRSIFFEGDTVTSDLTRARDYARLLASVGINGCAINNVNANTKVLTHEFVPQLVRVAEAFRPWGVRLAIAVDFSSPQRIGGLDTFDPLDPGVAAFWKARVDDLYAAIPDLGGFVLKADSEGRLGPSAYGRTHADAANAIARALAPHDGVLFYRGFVYDHHMDWRNPANDRARAAYDNFTPLDGQFDDNVILQVKHGPIDFQVREPASPLFGALRKTNMAIELQITQEYLGQQRHVVFLPPMWKTALDFDMQAAGPGTPVSAIVSGRTFKRPQAGFVGVSNVGRSTNWLGHDLAMANLYGFGRLAWNAGLTSEQIAEEWTRLTFSSDPRKLEGVSSILLDSWRTYENYSGPLGAGTLTDIIGVHYGPGVESSERNGWGQWHRADDKGIGMDRTSATGTGYIAQYSPTVAAVFESLATCPEELLLFMHHVPYTHVLKKGDTVIQRIYDTHYQGAEEAAGFVTRWQDLESGIDQDRYRAVLEKLEYQAGHAIVWRDAVSSWFLKASGIPDGKGRAGHFPGRFEAEQMRLDGYTVKDVTPWETASGGKAVTCVAASCSVSFDYTGASGTFDLAVQYFDEMNGASRFRLLVRGQEVDAWIADLDLPTRDANGHSATRHVSRGVRIAPGDTIRVEGVRDGTEPAPLDYIEIAPRVAGRQ